MSETETLQIIAAATFGFLLRHFLPKIISTLAVLAVKLKRKFQHGIAQWTV